MKNKKQNKNIGIKLEQNYENSETSFASNILNLSERKTNVAMLILRSGSQ